MFLLFSYLVFLLCKDKKLYQLYDTTRCLSDIKTPLTPPRVGFLLSVVERRDIIESLRGIYV